MANSTMDGGSGSAKKKMKPGVAKRVSDRKAFVSEKTGAKGITKKQANQRFFVQTRMSEMKAKGKTVTPEMRKKLQQKFQSGDVARKGFAAPKKSTGGSGAVTVAKKPPVVKSTGKGRGYKPQVTISPIGMNQSAKLAHTLYGEPTTKHSRLAHAEGARLAAPSGPYIGRNRCIAKDDTCEGPKARGTDFCIGHLRNKGEA